MTATETAHLTDRYVVVSEGQHYGNFPSLELAEKQARSIAKVTGYAEVTFNGFRFYVTTGEV